MKIWKSLVIILLLSLLSWGSFEVYQRLVHSRTINSLDLISSDAVFLFETQQAEYAWHELRKQPIWLSLVKLPAFQNLESQVNSLDSLMGEEGFVTKTIRNKQVTASYHAVGSDKFSLLYTINFGSTTPNEFLDKLKSRSPRDTRFQSRKYSDHDIYDVLNGNNSIQWSITLLNNVLLISSSSFVIEEAIRLYLNEDVIRFSSKLGEELPNPEGLGRLILTSKGISKLLSGILKDKNAASIQELQAADYVLALNLHLENEQLQFKGAIQGLPEVDFLPSVQAQLADFESFISTRTLAVTQINLKDSYETQKLLNSTFIPISTLSGEIQTRLIDRGFFDFLSGEHYLVEMEPLISGQENLALLVKSKNPEQAWALLKQYRDTTEFYPLELYQEHEILYFPEEELPAHLFNGRFTGFKQTYISKVGTILLMSNSSIGIKTLLEDHAKGHTWDKNPEKKKPLLSPSAGFGKIWLLQKILPKWILATNPSWNTFLQKYETALQSFTSLSLKIHKNSKGEEATLHLNYSKEQNKLSELSKSFSLNSSKNVAFPQQLIYGPKTVLNFNDGSEDLVIQDQQHTLYVINSAGEQVFSRSLSGPIISQVFQIDYFKNNKLQLLFATPDSLFAVDRLGAPLPGFPLALPEEKITELNLVDYDNSKEYRFFIATESGNLWLLDKSGKSLEGWNPLKLGENIIGPPFHTRIQGEGDFMVALGKSGKLYLFNRRGELSAGFPVLLPNQPSGPPTVRITPSPRLQVVSSDGEVVEIAVTGELSRKTQLQKLNRDDTFRELPDQNGRTSLIVLEQFNKTQLLDEQQAAILTIPLVNNQSWIGYYDFGSTRKIIAVTDLANRLGYLYDQNGNLLHSTPFQSEGEIQISHQPNQGLYLIRTRHGETLLEFLIPD